jgi:NitT/TauT family transport system substrate-binding protein
MVDKDIKNLWNYDWSRSDWTRRNTLDLLAKGGLAAAAMSLGISGRALANQQQDDVVRIGYLPITDATALLVAHFGGFF